MLRVQGGLREAHGRDAARAQEHLGTSRLPGTAVESAGRVHLAREKGRGCQAAHPPSYAVGTAFTQSEVLRAETLPTPGPSSGCEHYLNSFYCHNEAGATGIRWVGAGNAALNTLHAGPPRSKESPGPKVPGAQVGTDLRGCRVLIPPRGSHGQVPTRSSVPKREHFLIHTRPQS